jgi:hypothetical protein
MSLAKPDRERNDSGGAGAAAQFAVCSAVVSSVWATVLQVASSNHGGVHETTRQAIRPLQAIS